MNGGKDKYTVRLPCLEEFGLEVPCRKACPVHTEAGRYVRAIATGSYQEAYRIAREPNPLASICARICAAPCEDICRRGKLDAPVSIRALKRFVCELHEDQENLASEAEAPDAAACAASGIAGKVAVIGGGPAGISCAHELADLGYQVTLFESSERLGGALWKYIPAYRLPRAVIDRELQALTGKNVEIRLEEGLDDSRDLDALSRQGFRTFFLACGADRALDLAIEGRDAQGVYKAIEYLITVNRGINIDLGEKVVVISGGHKALDVGHPAGRTVFEDDAGFTASDPGLSGIDAARSALRLGARSVTITSLESLEEMVTLRSGTGREDLQEAIREGVRLMPGIGPKRILVEGGTVTGVEFLKVDQLRDEHGKVAPTFRPGSGMRLEADSVIMAIGRMPDLFFLTPRDGVQLAADGRLHVDLESMQTSALDVFGGGDCAKEPGIIIEAVADGKRAAASMHRFLRDARFVEKTTVHIQHLDPELHRRHEVFDIIPRHMPEMLSSAKRDFLTEVERKYTEAMAREQAERCLDCSVQTMYDPESCILCGACIDICPYRCLRFVADDRLETEDGPTGAFLAATHREETVVLIKDDEACIRCGLCCRVCPTGALSLERIETVHDTAAETPQAHQVAENA